MRPLVRFVRRVQYLMRYRRREQDLADEMADHRARTREALERRGLATLEAEVATRRALGSTLAARDAARDVWIWPWLQSLAQDVRFAGRLLAKDRSFTVVTVLALALGIGVNSTQFTVVNAICLRGLPIARPDRVLHIGTRDARDREGGVSYRDVEDLRSTARTFTGIAAYGSTTLAVGDPGRAPDRAIAAYVSAATLSLIGEAPQLGRDFRDDDDRPGAAPVVILGDGLWKRRYGADSAMLGRTIVVGGTTASVIGVMPARFKFPNNADVWLPLASMPGVASQPRDARTLTAFGRLIDAGGANQQTAQAELGAIATRLAQQYPDTNAGIRAVVVPMNDRYNGDITHPAWIIFITVGALLVLVACGNVAGLLLMRSARRGREIAIRVALGATRRRVVRQLLIESLTLAMLGGLAGLGVSVLGARIFASAIPEDALPYWIAFTLDGRVVAMLAAVCLGTTLIFGLAPALHIARTDVNGVLKETDRTASGGVRTRRWTSAFLALEFALTMTLLANMTSSLWVARQTVREALVIETAPLTTMWVTLGNQRYESRAARLAFYARLEDRLRVVPAISAATLTTSLPFNGAPLRQLTIDGPSTIGGDKPPTVRTIVVGSRYFETLALPLFRGRAFTDVDGTTGHDTVIVNRRFASMFFGTDDPIGRRMRLTADRTPASARDTASAPWVTIVGIAPDIPQPRTAPFDPIAYLPYRADAPATLALMVRATSDPEAIASMLREEVRALDPDLPVYRVRTMAQVVSESRWNPRVAQGLITVIAGIALALSAVGLYAMLAHAIAVRAREIGVRIALGARGAQVFWLVLRRALLQLGIGLVGGGVLLFAWDRVFGGDPKSMLDPFIVVPVAMLMVLMTIAAACAPAWRATRVDPVTALRHE